MRLSTLIPAVTYISGVAAKVLPHRRGYPSYPVYGGSSSSITTADPISKTSNSLETSESSLTSWYETEPGAITSTIYTTLTPAQTATISQTGNSSTVAPTSECSCETGGECPSSCSNTTETTTQPTTLPVTLTQTLTLTHTILTTKSNSSISLTETLTLTNTVTSAISLTSTYLTGESSSTLGSATGTSSPTYQSSSSTVFTVGPTGSSIMSGTGFPTSPPSTEQSTAPYPYTNTSSSIVGPTGPSTKPSASGPISWATSPWSGSATSSSPGTSSAPYPYSNSSSSLAGPTGTLTTGWTLTGTSIVITTETASICWWNGGTQTCSTLTPSTSTYVTPTNGSTVGPALTSSAPSTPCSYHTSSHETLTASPSTPQPNSTWTAGPFNTSASSIASIGIPSPSLNSTFTVTLPWTTVTTTYLNPSASVPSATISPSTTSTPPGTSTNSTSTTPPNTSLGPESTSSLYVVFTTVTVSLEPFPTGPGSVVGTNPTPLSSTVQVTVSGSATATPIGTGPASSTPSSLESPNSTEVGPEGTSSTSVYSTTSGVSTSPTAVMSGYGYQPPTTSPYAPPVYKLAWYDPKLKQKSGARGRFRRAWEHENGGTE